MKLNARLLHGRGFKGGGVRVGVMDSGLPKSHPDFSHVAERTDWTDDGNPSDTVGHGTFVAGVISGKNRECAGLAPDAEIHAVSENTSETSELPRLTGSRPNCCSGWSVQSIQFEVTRVHRVVHRCIQFCDVPANTDFEPQRRWP